MDIGQLIRRQNKSLENLSLSFRDLVFSVLVLIVPESIETWESKRNQAAPKLIPLPNKFRIHA